MMKDEPSQHDTASFQPDGAGELAGQLAVVTGSSSGIGRATAIELARAGADVIVHGHRAASDAEAFAEQIREIGRQSKLVMFDLSVPALQDQFLAAATADQVPDVWVNCAGADVLTGEAADLPFEDKLALLWRVDVVATIRLSRAAGRQMQARGRGTIINLGWDQARRGMAGDSGEMFAATKGAVTAFTQSLARSLAPEVRVNCVAPGWIRTKWGRTASPAWQERAQRESLSGRWGAPEDVARVVRFLASPAAEFINGQVIDVNGGWRGAAP